MHRHTGMMELTDQEMELAAGGACQRLVAVVYVDSDADGDIDEVWLIYGPC